MSQILDDPVLSDIETRDTLRQRRDRTSGEAQHEDLRRLQACPNQMD
jgi:hypothetical protein